MKKIIVINGPNLNLLGQRETSIYGDETLEIIESRMKDRVASHEVELQFFQSNHEGAIIDFLQTFILPKRNGKEEKKTAPLSGIIINAGALTHTSVGIRDALSALQVPFIELHVSNVFRREPFRHHSYLSDIATGVVAGLGTKGYDLALAYFLGDR